MYYEEKMINGVMHWRSHPDDDFQPYTLEQLSQKYDAAKQARRSGMGEWQPIETLPKNSEPVLLYYPAQSGRNAISEWIIIGLNNLPRKPTHWMPAPEPPEPKA